MTQIRQQSVDCLISAYFRSLSLPSDLSRHHTPIVDIEGGGLRWLLDQITLARPPTIETWDTADTIAHLGQRYQFGRLPWIMAQNMQPCVEESPVQVFIFASQNDLEPLAKAAITQLGNDPDWHGLRIREFRQSWLGGAKAEYVVALIVAMRSTEGKHEAVDWKKVAEMFKIER